MHSGGKGISKSSLPYKRSPPSWLKISAQEVTEHVCKLAKKGLTPSQVRSCLGVGVLLEGGCFTRRRRWRGGHVLLGVYCGRVLQVAVPDGKEGRGVRRARVRARRRRRVSLPHGCVSSFCVGTDFHDCAGDM